MQQINLYQPIFRAPRRVFSARTSAQSMIVLCLALAAVQGYGLWKVGTLGDRVAQLSAMRDRELLRLEEVTRAHPPATSSPLLKRALAQAADALERAQSLSGSLTHGALGNSRGFSAHLAGLARRRVEGTWLNAIRIAEGGDAISVAGEALRPELVPALVRQLAQEPAFAGRTFSSLNLHHADADTQAASGAIRFEIATAMDAVSGTAPGPDATATAARGDR
ncbi:MAG: PilN domain-containing protein [Gammaproteobacteria bacterium]